MAVLKNDEFGFTGRKMTNLRGNEKPIINIRVLTGRYVIHAGYILRTGWKEKDKKFS